MSPGRAKPKGGVDLFLERAFAIDFFAKSRFDEIDASIR
jgi:hypothetical protein